MRARDIVESMFESESKPINWDVSGIGGVPNQQSVDYFGFTKQMTPAEFRALVPPGNENSATKEFILQAIPKGDPIAPPFLIVGWVHESKSWQVFDHEGRSRSDAARQVAPSATMPVSIFPSGMRARNLTPEMIDAPFIAQRR